MPTHQYSKSIPIGSRSIHTTSYMRIPVGCRGESYKNTIPVGCRVKAGFSIPIGKREKTYLDIKIGCRVYVDEVINRFSMKDEIKLRSSIEYSNPDFIFDLQIVIGDLSRSKIPTFKIDDNWYFISDRQMQLIDKVYEGDSETILPYTAYEKYVDETGHAIACLYFTTPPSGVITVSGKGIVDDTGTLIENPADIIEYLLLDIQGYTESIIDKDSLAEFKQYCLTKFIKLAMIIEKMKVKELLDEMAKNLYSYWYISDGKSIFRSFE